MKHYFWIAGRTGRIEYILISLVTELLSICFLNILERITTQTTPSLFLVTIAWIILAFMGLFAWIAFTCLIRRMHDLNCSGWWLLAFIFIGFVCAILHIPVAGPLMFAGGKLFLWFMPGSANPNRFGPVFHMADSLWKNPATSSSNKEQIPSAPIEKRIDFKL